MFTSNYVVYLSICAWITASRSLGSSSARKHEESVSTGTIARARCASRCVSLHITRISSLSKQAQNNGSLVWCENHKHCSKCLEPCKSSWDLKENQCRNLCESLFPKKHYECVTSCEFRRSVEMAKQGDCPSSKRAGGFAAACVESCDRDGECPALRKCCSNGCGHTCQLPKNLFKGVPLKPRKDLSFAELPSSHLEIRWSSKFNVSVEPVLYVMQQRWNYGLHPSEDDSTDWQTVGQTTEERVQLANIRASRWYQFRVASVNIHGTRGFTDPSKHFCSSRDPSAPPTPSSLRVTGVSAIADGTVSARVCWTLPEESDIPVHHFRVYWSWAASDGFTALAKKKRRKTSRGVLNSVDLEGLRANSSYTVEVQAVAYWGKARLKSTKASLNFSTAGLNDTKKGPSTPKNFEEPTASFDPGTGSTWPLGVGNPFYRDSQLQVRVYWKKRGARSRYHVQWGPEFCSHNVTRGPEKSVTQENYLDLPGLLFSCRYRVTVRVTRSRDGDSKAEGTTFLTPPCSTLRTKSRGLIRCPEEAGAASLKVVAKPENLTASFSVRGGNVTGRFFWRVPLPRPHQRVTGLQVTWAAASTDSRQKSQSGSIISQSQILPPDRGRLVVPDMRPGTDYRLEVRAVTRAGEGSSLSRTFQTPSVSSAPDQRPKLRQRQRQRLLGEY